MFHCQRVSVDILYDAYSGVFTGGDPSAIYQPQRLFRSEWSNGRIGFTIMSCVRSNA